MPNITHQRGQSLIGFVIGTALLSLLLVSLFSFMQTERQNEVANQQGAALAQYGVGLRGFIANVQGGSQTLAANPYTVTGVAWLKPPSCGGKASNPVQGYVPCSFSGGSMGLSYSTTTTLTPATNSIEARTTFIEPVIGSNANSPALMAALVAFATTAQQTLPSNGTFLTAFYNTPLAATAQVTASAVAPADAGRVLLVVNNSPSNDVFLRVDGTNQMIANINAGGHSLTNAQDGSFAGNVRAQGTVEIDNGLSVTAGTADLRGGVIAPDVNVSSVGHMASQAIYNAQIYTGATSYTVPMPDCSLANLGVSAPAIYVAMQGTGTPEANNGDALYEAHANVTISGSNWIVQPIMHTTTFTLSGSTTATVLTMNLNKTVAAENPTDQVLLVMTKCK